jgi:hypothetical protein
MKLKMLLTGIIMIQRWRVSRRQSGTQFRVVPATREESDNENDLKS